MFEEDVKDLQGEAGENHNRVTSSIERAAWMQNILLSELVIRLIHLDKYMEGIEATLDGIANDD